MRKFFPALLAIVFAFAVMFPAMGGAMRAHAHESGSAVYVQDHDASAHPQELDAPSYIENTKQGVETADGSGQCPEGHASNQACCGTFCHAANMPSDFGRISLKFNGNRLVVMVVAPALKQRPTFIERPPKSIDPIFG